MKFIGPVLLMLLILASCSLFKQVDDPLSILIQGDHFTLAWDDDFSSIAGNANRAVSYRVYYRPHGSYYWRFLDETVASGSPRLIISSEYLDFGIYDFGVSAINGSGSESSIHSSLDNTADPFCGWYINWIGSK